MRRKACALLMSATLGGCMSFDGGPGNSPACTGSWGQQYGPPAVPGLAGPHGQRVPMAQPYASNPPGNAYVAQQMMNRSVPLSMVQINRGMNAPGAMPGAMPGMAAPAAGAVPPTPIPSGGVLTPPGIPFAPGVPAGPNITPASFMQGGGPAPMNAQMPQGPTGGIMTAQYAIPNPALQGHPHVAAQRTQVRFVRPTGMKITWFTQGPDGRPTYSNIPLETPARYNFPQAAIYRLKLSNIEARPGLEIYPTMEVVPSNPKTEAFLAHSSVPLEFTQEDFRQVVDGNYVTKVIYLPDPQFQDVAGTGIDEIISTRLEPGADPVQEALRRGSILLIIRMGNVDQEAPNTPPLGAVAPLPPGAPIGPGHGPGAGHGPGMPPGFQVPYIGNRPILPPMPGGPMPGGPVMAPGGVRGPLTPPPPPGLQAPPRAPLGAGLPPVPPSVGAVPNALPNSPFNSGAPSVAPNTGNVLPPTSPIATPSAAPQSEPLAAPKLAPKRDVPPLPSVPPLPTSNRGSIVPTPTASTTRELPRVVTPPAPAVVPVRNEGPANAPVQPAVVSQPDVVVPPPTVTTPFSEAPTTSRPELPRIITPEQPAPSSSLPEAPADIHVPAPTAGTLPSVPSAELPPLPAAPQTPELPALPALPAR